MRIIGVRDEEKIKKLLAAKAACEMAGLPVPPQIEAELGEGYEEKSPKDLTTVLLSTDALTPWTEGEEAGFEINLPMVPSNLKTLRVTMASALYAQKAAAPAVQPAAPVPTIATKPADQKKPVQVDEEEEDEDEEDGKA